jgi:multiple sugar transport system permease protein
VADFPLYLHNSALIALLSALGMTLSSAVVAYGFSRLEWGWRDRLFTVVLATLMVPFPVIMAPLYLVFRSLGWIGTFLPLIVPAWFGGAFSIYLLRQFFLTIPRELDEAARLDGCSEFGVFVRVILPTAAPALGVVALLQVVASWNDFLGPLLFLNHQDHYPVSLGLHMYQSQHGGAEWNVTMAATMIAVAPVIVLFVLARRALMAGVSAQGSLTE